MIARLEATVAFLADALGAFGDRDTEDLRRVKAVALLANPVRAVELLAAFAALRARASTSSSRSGRSRSLVARRARPAGGTGSTSRIDQLDQPDDQLDQPADALDRPDGARPGGRTGSTQPDGSTSPTSALGRMDAFARRVRVRRRAAAGLARGPRLRRRGPRPDRDPPDPRFGFDWSQLLPPLTLYLHLSADDLAAGTAGWSGGRARDRSPTRSCTSTCDRCTATTSPVIDLAHQAPVDAYEMPDRLREAVRLRDPGRRVPLLAPPPAARVDADHTLPYDPTPARPSRQPRQWSTRLGNLGPLGRFHHRIKTHGKWMLRQPFDGILPVARPARPGLPRRPHRHPQDHPPAARPAAHRLRPRDRDLPHRHRHRGRLRPAPADRPGQARPAGSTRPDSVYAGPPPVERAQRRLDPAGGEVGALLADLVERAELRRPDLARLAAPRRRATRRRRARRRRRPGRARRPSRPTAAASR